MIKLNRAHKLLERGLQLHQAGQLAKAEQVYLEAAALDPRNPNIFNLRGLVALANGRPRDAVTLLCKATALQSDNPGFWGNLGNALFEAGEYTEAENAFHRASRLAPGNPDFGIGIANSLSASGRPNEALAILQTVVANHPDRAQAWFSLARLAEKAGNAEAAMALYQRALQADPYYGNAHLNLGALLQTRQLLAEAEQSYRQALAYCTHRETAYINLVSTLIHQGKFDDAEYFARAGTAEFPRSAALYSHCSAACAQKGNLAAAREPALKAAALEPGNPKRQLALGGVLLESGYPEHGMDVLEKTRLAYPQDMHIAYVVGITQLTLGRFHEGWQTFIHREARQAMYQTRPWLANSLPLELRGIRLRVLREQGLGDELFFLRFVTALKRLGATVTYQSNPKLVSMLQRNADIDEVSEKPVSREYVLPPPEGSLDLIVGDLPPLLYRRLSLQQCSLPADTAVPPARGLVCPRIFYPEIPPPLALSALPELITTVREQLQRLGPPPYLALTWRGGIAPHEQTSESWTLFKNISLDAFGRALSGLPHTLLAVQRKPLPGEIDALARSTGTSIHDLCEVNEDLEQMLALMAVVDDYVGVSNTNMHLRAGLGLSARVLVPRPSEWRWMAYGDTSPWFPDFRVYRQGLDGSWQTAMERLHNDLSATRVNT